MNVRTLIIYLCTLFIQLPFLSAQQSQLVLIKKFPNHNSELADNYLIHPWEITKLKKIFYVSDWRDNSLKMFSEKGDFVRVIAKKGSGPGEVVQPVNIASDDITGLVICEDRGNSRISCFSLEGTFLTSFRTSLFIEELVAKNGLIFAATFSESQTKLFTVWDDDGKLIKQFGEPFDSRVDKLPYRKDLYHSVDMRIKQDSLYVAFVYLPFIHVYDLNGNFARSIRVKIDFVKSAYEHNLNSKKVMHKNVLKYDGWLRGFYVDSDKIYYYAFKQGKFFILDYSGNLLNTISFKMKEQYDTLLSRKFITKEADHFYFTQLDDAQILVFKLIEE